MAGVVDELLFQFNMTEDLPTSRDEDVSKPPSLKREAEEDVDLETPTPPKKQVIVPPCPP